MQQRSTLLKVEKLTKGFHRGNAFWGGSNVSAPAVNSISLDIYQGECFALIGESGSGKSTFGKCLLRLLEPSSGRIIYRGVDLLKLPEKQFRPYRRHFQMLFQNPFAAFNPKQSIRSCLSEPLKVLKNQNRRQIADQIADMMQRVGLPPELVHRFPHELSGGQLQRLALARALMTKPILLVADEPTSSLDAHFRGRIIELLQKVQQDLNMTLFLISHDWFVVREIAHRIAVIYRGEIVEIASAKQFLKQAVHPYASLLVASADYGAGQQGAVEKMGPETSIAPENHACCFAHRCPVVQSICFEKKPQLRDYAPDHQVACHLTAEIIRMPEQVDRPEKSQAS